MINFKLEENEFVEGCALVALWPRKVVFGLALQCAVLLIAAGCVAFSGTVTPESFAVAGILAAAAPFIAIATVIGRPVMLRRKYRRTFRRVVEPLPPASVSWNAAGFEAVRSGKTTFTAWKDLSSWQQTDLLIVLRQPGNKIFMLPQRAFSTPGKSAEFIRALRDGQR